MRHDNKFSIKISQMQRKKTAETAVQSIKLNMEGGRITGEGTDGVWRALCYLWTVEHVVDHTHC